MKSKAKKQSVFVRILKSPVRVLQKVTNFYMNSMFDCANRIGETTVVNCSIAPQVSQLPRNFSVSSSKDSKQEEELSELIRAVSTKLNKIEIKTVDQFQKPSMSLANAVEKRSYSVGIGRIGRIDEETPCEFKEVADANAYPRCKSYAVPNRLAVRS